MKNLQKCLRLAVCAAATCGVSPGQTPPAIVLEVDTANAVNYVDDVADPLKKASAPGVTPVPAGVLSTWKSNMTLGDIVAVNRKPAKGMIVIAYHPRPLGLPAVTPGRAIFDTGGGCQIQVGIIIMKDDGTPVGTIIANGTTALGPPPGAPLAATGLNLVVAGGTGAYLGVRGQAAQASAVGVRSASMLEDPAYRRVNGGGTQRFVVHLIEAPAPQVLATPAGPAISHIDFTSVTAASPARAGEWLVVRATGLGPTTPNLGPGAPFPPYEAGKVHLVNAPVEVTVGGRVAEVRNVIGWPGETGVYRVDVRVPDDIPAGSASLGLSAAWIAGPAVQLPVIR